MHVPKNIVVAVVVAGALAFAPRVSRAADSTLAVARDSTLTYSVVHKLHAVEGVCKLVEGKVRLLEGGGVQAMVRARIDCFDSGNGNRDAHMKETTEAEKFPYVEWKGIAEHVVLPAAAATALVTLEGQVSFHGVQQPIEVKVELSNKAEHLVAEAHLLLSLDAFRIERPSLLFVKIDDALKLDAHLVLSREK